MNSIFNFRNIIEEELKKAVSELKTEEKLKKAMGYSLLAGGKRIRPLLAVASYNLIGKSPDEIYPLCVSLEMIHTYSLIHDDLPAMDDDDLRRGKPSNHKAFGEAQAILAGDALLNEAFTHFLKAYRNNTNCADALLEISERAGSSGMIMGQMLDIESQGKEIKPYDLNLIHSKKTGDLITASLTAPALLLGMPGETLEKLKILGGYLGLLFQIEDDILDFSSTPEVLGKTPGKDLTEGKNTYVTIFGMEKSREMAEDTYRKALETAESLGDKAIFLIEITKSLYSREK